MFDFLRDSVYIVLEIVCCFILFETFVDCKYSRKINMLQFGLQFACIYFSSVILSDHIFTKQFVIIIEYTFFLFWTFRIQWKYAFFFAFLYMGVVTSIDGGAFLIIQSFFQNQMQTDSIIAMQNSLIVLFGKTILFVCVLWFRKYFGKEDLNTLTKKEWVCFLIFPLFIVISVITMFSTFDKGVQKKELSFLFLIVVGMLGMNILMFYFMKAIIKREKQLQQERISGIKAQCQMEEYEKQKQKAHEYKNQILCIEALLEKKQYAEVTDYVKQLYGEIEQTEDVVNTNQPIVNAVLNMKYHEAVEKGILCVMQINDLSRIRVSEDDLVILLSNLFNNAIEACEQCRRKKRIWLSVQQKEEIVILKMENTFEQTLCYDGETIKTTKKQEKEHGYGIKNMIRVIKKYDGEYHFGEKKGKFIFLIRI